MNRSYSKIRHIQEVNQRLENRILKEQKSYGDDNTSFEENIMFMDDIANHYHPEITKDKLEYLITMIQDIILNAAKYYELSDEELDKLRDYAEGLISNMSEGLN